MAELLVELLSEEIPARMQARAADDLKRLVTLGLAKARLDFTAAQAFVTPRRLVLVVEGLPERQPDIEEERKGPRVGAPQGAIDGFLKATGLASIAEAKVQESGKGSFYFAVRQIPGQPARDALPAVLTAAITQMPWPKSMRWGSGTFRWVRPLHSVLAILDGEPLPWSIDCGGSGDTAMQLIATDATQGHRFLAPDTVRVASFADYQDKLAAAKVMLDADGRRQLIRERAEAIAAAEGLTLKADAGLLDEVTGLVEWPVVLMGHIDEAFMGLPPEVLTTAMRAHQKYFALVHADGRLAPRFIVVANMETPDEGRTVVAGNERVLRARLSDAKFFWDQDRKTSQSLLIRKLQERIFHAKLGSDNDKTKRINALGWYVADQLGVDTHAASVAASFCKIDLTTAMVGEFPELQGIMGGYYIRHAIWANESKIAPVPNEVAIAISEHYSPLGPSDRCPTARLSVTLALADKIDTLVGFFAIGEKPTGSGDPYALRRAALGVIRLIVENGLRLSLRRTLESAIDIYQVPQRQQPSESELAVARQFSSIDRGRLVGEILAFFADRLKVHLREQGVRHDLIAAVFATGSEDDLVRLLARVEALRGFLNTEDGANVLIAYRRASNIVRIEENRESVSYGGAVDPALFVQPEETHLHNELTNAHEGIAAALTAERFGEAMSILARLRAPVDAFFDRVTVNCGDAGMRGNRLRLLSQIRAALGDVADFSQIEG